MDTSVLLSVITLVTSRSRYAVCEDSEEASVFAAPMKHTISCVGFVIEEKMRYATLKV